MSLRPIVAVMACLFLPLSGTANPDSGERPPRPPREAVDACADKQEDDACSFSHRDRTLEGQCMAGPRPELPLACRPDDAPPPPPPEAGR